MTPFEPRAPPAPEATPIFRNFWLSEQVNSLLFFRQVCVGILSLMNEILLTLPSQMIFISTTKPTVSPPKISPIHWLISMPMRGRSDSHDLLLEHANSEFGSQPPLSPLLSRFPEAAHLILIKHRYPDSTHSTAY